MERYISVPLTATITMTVNGQNMLIHIDENTPATSPEVPTPPPAQDGVQPLLGKRFYIDPGHGGKDPGACNTTLGLQEKVAALDIGHELGIMLAQKGAQVEFSRIDNNTYPSIGSRARAANAFDATAFISVHLNSAENKQARGVEVLVYSNKGVAGTLAKNVLTPILSATGFKDRGVKERPDLGVLSGTKMPAILVEVGFISDDEEAKLLFTPSIQLKIAEAIAQGVIKTFA